MDSGRTKKELGSSRNSATRELDTQFNERYRRLRADFDNYRRRSEVKLASARSAAEDELLLEMFEVVDNIEAGLEQARESQGMPNGFVEGLQLIHDQAMQLLERKGVERVKSIGRKFDHNVHVCMSRMPSSDFEEDVVIHELRAGYVREGRMLRPAQVVIAEEQVGDAMERRVAT